MNHISCCRDFTLVRFPWRAKLRFEMHNLRWIILMLLAIWLPMAAHGRMMSAVCAENLDLCCDVAGTECCGSAMDAGSFEATGCHCERHVCRALNAGCYLITLRSVSSPQPHSGGDGLAVDSFSRFFRPVGVRELVSPVDPFSSGAHLPWQFVFRAAALARAPSAVC